MKETETKKPERQYSINLPDQYRKALKLEAIKLDTTVRQIILEMLKQRYG